jgi:hypothetical protein
MKLGITENHPKPNRTNKIAQDAESKNRRIAVIGLCFQAKSRDEDGRRGEGVW